MESMWLWRACGYGEDVAMERMWLWRACGYGEHVAMESMWQWRACGYGEHVAMESMCYAFHLVAVSDTRFGWIPISYYVVKRYRILKILDSVVKFYLAEMQFDTNIMSRVPFFVQSQNLGHLNMAERCFFCLFLP